MAENTEKSLAELKPEESVEVAKSNKKSGLLIFSLFFILALLIAAGAGGYYLWQQQQQALQQSQLQQSSLQQQISELQTTTGRLSQSANENQQAVSQLQSQIQMQLDEANELSQRAIAASNRSQRGWMLNEIDYLLRIAHRRLQISRDINSAIAALEAADQRLHDLGDMNLFNIRKQLAKDIASLKALHQVDVNGTALSLDHIILLVHELPFKTAKDEIKSQLENNVDQVPAEPEQASGFVDSVISTMINIGDIKIHKRAIKPASSDQQQIQIEQLLQTYLLSARLAVLRYDQLQFNHDIEQSIQLLHLHYKTEDNRVQQMQKDLTTFSGLVLNPDLPEMTTAWSMLQKALQSENSRVTPDNTKSTPPVQNKTTKAEVL
ncbi:MAG TPA: uroporphyrinogen-III C-methyltransferase [Gammaproteobacteria bacterium]